MFMNVGDATNSPHTLEKWHDKAKLVLSGAKEMASTIVSKIFKCQDLDVLCELLKALKCLHCICYYYALQVSHTKMCKTSSFESLYNPTYAPANQMDCFQLAVEIRDFFGNVKPLLDEIENNNDMIEIYHISYIISHFVQDFIVRNRDFHLIAPPYVKRSKKCSTWAY